MGMHSTTQLKRDWSAIALGALFVVMLVWWLAISNLGEDPASIHAKMIWGASYQLVALWGGIWGLIISTAWGGTRSVMGRSIMAFAIGLLLQNFGQSVFSYYNLVAQVELPYPSMADIGFFGSIPFYAYGTVMLARASGVKISLRTFSSKLQAVTIPLIMLGLSYFFFLREYEIDPAAPLRTFLDFGYPLGQAFYVSLALLTYLLSTRTLGGVMKNRVLLILFALVVQYAADYNFLFQASSGTWSVSGYGDVIYLLAYFLMAISLLQLKTRFIRTRNSEEKS